jgi:hypothetical protein
MAGDSATMRDKITAAITAWAEKQPRWTPVPANDEIGRLLDIVASASTFQVAKRLLADRGVIAKHGNGYYVAGEQPS